MGRWSGWFGAGKRTAAIHGALPYDKAGYTVREVASTVPEGYAKVGDWTIPATEQTDAARRQYILDDHGIDARIQIVKVDAETGGKVAVAVKKRYEHMFDSMI